VDDIKANFLRLNKKGTLLWEKDPFYRFKIQKGIQIVSNYQNILIGVSDFEGNVLVFCRPNPFLEDYDSNT
jgi:hypothetical protein